jgi:plasmid stabilization system protein ParE
MPCAFTPFAEADLEAIGDYIARDNPRRALTFIRSYASAANGSLICRARRRYGPSSGPAFAS